MATPTGSEGRFEVTVSLVTSDGIVLSEAKATLLIAPPGQRQAGGATFAERGRAPAPAGGTASAAGAAAGARGPRARHEAPDRATS